MAKGGKIVFFVFHLMIGLYLINFGFNLFKVPEIITSLDKWIISLGGALVVFGGVSYMRTVYNRLSY